LPNFLTDRVLDFLRLGTVICSYNFQRKELKNKNMALQNDIPVRALTICR
jgi:hypothetical protein